MKSASTRQWLSKAGISVWLAIVFLVLVSARNRGAAGVLSTLDQYVLTNQAGQTIRLFSKEAYAAEFRYLRRIGHQIDITGPSRRMRLLQEDVSETQWPFMQFCYFGYACANLARADPDLRSEAETEMRWLINAIQQPRLSGFITDHFGPPFGPEFRQPSVFCPWFVPEPVFALPRMHKGSAV